MSKGQKAVSSAERELDRLKAVAKAGAAAVAKQQGLVKKLKKQKDAAADEKTKGKGKGKGK